MDKELAPGKNEARLIEIDPLYARSPAQLKQRLLDAPLPDVHQPIWLRDM